MTFTTTSTNGTTLAELQKQIQTPMDPSTSFPCMLHQCLTDIEALEQRDPSMRKLSSIIGWQRHGTAFKVHDRKKFEELILPVWFIRLKYTSFIRQMNMYGFKKIQKDEVSSGLQKGAMYHELFLQGQPELAQGIGKAGKTKQPALPSLPPSLPKSCPLHQDAYANSYYSGGMGAIQMTKSIGNRFMIQGNGNMMLQGSPGCPGCTTGYVSSNSGNANGLVNLLHPSRNSTSTSTIRPSTTQSNRFVKTTMYPNIIKEQLPDIDVSDLFDEHQWGDASLEAIDDPLPFFNPVY